MTTRKTRSLLELRHMQPRAPQCLKRFHWERSRYGGRLVYKMFRYGEPPMEISVSFLYTESRRQIAYCLRTARAELFAR